jgi:LysR family transcriptional regulator for bpeEF and oprC
MNRTTRSLHLTDEGRNYLAKMVSISHQVDDLKHLSSQQENLSGSLKLTAPIMLGQHDIPEILVKFKNKYPKVKISLTLMNRKVDLIEEGYDIAIRAGHLNDSSLYAKHVSEVVVKTVVSKAYLHSNEMIKHPKDLVDHNCIVNTAVANPRRWPYQIDGAEKLIKVDGDMEANDSTYIVELVKAGLGVARVPLQYVKQELSSGELVELLTEFNPPALPVNIIYPSAKLMSATQRALIDFMGAEFEQSLG